MQELFKKPTALAISIGAIAVRLLPHPGNMTPVGATAIFGGAKLTRPWNYLAPLLVLFVTDLFLGFHALMPYVYGSFIISVWLSERFLKNSVSAKKLLILAGSNALIFFLVTNAGVWLEGRLYPPTPDGLLDSYVMGLPFLRNMLIGDLGYTFGIFGIYAWSQRTHFVQGFDKRLTSWLLESSN
ncbi:MAG: hypothetical protein UX60_C0038G0003 [Berkelbacteria bacterium GW2011_GWA2_46_7]|uniref:Uncharacterized protein n=1 Tax=Berkelbacteria bacterium GW2011_GWA2_46_7 TaxID=1618335 RepID=A0A0G1QDE9_9BACT|nr:MAG: hypothetical protein UX60_C0038G0003 [Berkelbacteria bacterium GW2011_GWA2_46_7]